jgi:FAD/FMN-containing dehydrogenase
METCVGAGGSITGEHGVGLDKSSYLPLIFSQDDMDVMLRIRAAFDPSGLCNPGKIIPLPQGCGEARAIATQSFFPGSPAESQSEGPAQPNFTTPLTKRNGKVGAPGAEVKRRQLAARMNETRVTRDLSRLLGDVGVRRLADFTLDLKSDSRAERLIEGFPASTEQAADIIEFAVREQLAVIPAGARTFVDGGNLMERADLILSTRQMKRMIKHEPADLVATAEAGLTLTEFQAQLAEKGQWLPVDAPDDASATLGAVVATATAGPQAFGYGSLRSFVIGLRAVLADARTLKAGGQVVKNVAGYDLCKLFTGSYGTLGVITEVTFKLRPLPAEVRTIVAFGEADALLQTGRRIARDFSPVAVEIVSSGLAESMAVGSERGECALLIRFAGPSRTVITQTAQALKGLRDNGFRCATQDDDVTLWSHVRNSALQTNHDLSWVTRVNPSALPTLVSDIVVLERDAAWRSVHWHAGIGDGRLRVMARSPIYHQEAVRELERRRQRAENSGGSLVLEKAPAEIKREFDSWGSFGSGSELMQRVKQQLDPDNLFSPGRFAA